RDESSFGTLSRSKSPGAPTRGAGPVTSVIPMGFPFSSCSIQRSGLSIEPSQPPQRPKLTGGEERIRNPNEAHALNSDCEDLTQHPALRIEDQTVNLVAGR